jgi:hypothetical protein
MLDFKPGDWLLNPLQEFINKGTLVESFIGQELVVYEHPSKKAQLYYWKRDARGSEAEVDYVIQHGPQQPRPYQGHGTLKNSQILLFFIKTHNFYPFSINTKFCI